MPITTTMEVAGASRVKGLRGGHHLLLVCWGGLIAIMLAGCDLTASGTARSPVHAKETSAMPTPAPNQQVAPPPIDRRISPATVTATFALG